MALSTSELESILILTSLTLIVLSYFVTQFGVFHYRSVMRRKYRYIQVISSTARGSPCPLCGAKITEGRTTWNIFLFPHLFKTLRHYEKRHIDIAIYARRLRIVMTLSLDLTAFGLPMLLATAYSHRSFLSLSLAEYLDGFTAAFLVCLFILWSAVALILYESRVK